MKRENFIKNLFLTFAGMGFLSSSKLLANKSKQYDVMQLTNEPKSSAVSTLKYTKPFDLPSRIQKEYDILERAPFKGTWSYDYIHEMGNDFYGTQKDWNQTLITSVNEISEKIIPPGNPKESHRWISISPEILSILRDSLFFKELDQQYFTIHINTNNKERVLRGGFLGYVSDKYSVFLDYYLPINKIVVGHFNNAPDRGYMFDYIHNLGDNYGVITIENISLLWKNNNKWYEPKQSVRN